MDFSDASAGALAYALRLAEAMSASVEVVHAVAPPPYVPLDMMLWAGPDERGLAELAGRLEERVAAVKGQASIRVTARLENGLPVDVILAAANNADVVVMGTHGRTGLRHAILGSVAERTLRFAQCPVLVVP